MVDRQWALKWRPPLPVTNQPDLLDQWIARQSQWQAPQNPGVAQDVQADTNQQAPRGSSWVDAPAPKPDTRVMPASTGTGAFGTRYTDPGGGWNPWSLYDGREGFDGSAQDGWYDATKDTAKGFWGPNGTPETDRDRVWRLTLDALGQNPGGQDPARVKQVFLEQVARLKRDYQANGMDWASSPFAGYDRMPGTQASGGQAQGQPAPAPGAAPASTTAAPAGTQGGQQGGTNVADITGGGGPSGSSLTNPITNPGGGAFGGAGLANMAEPAMAMRQYMQTHGMNPDGNGFFGDFIKKLMGSLGPAIMSLTLDQSGKPATDRLADLNSILDPIFYGGAGTLGANLGNFANQAQQGLMGALPGLSAPSQADLLRNLTALRTISMNPYMAEATGNRLDTGINKARDYAFTLAQQGKDTPNEFSLWDFIQNQLPQGYVSPFR